MKKVIILALLLTVLAVVFIGGGVCSADESDVYYYTSQNIEMRVTPSPESKVAIYVPATYAFKYVETLENYVKINYNGYEGYISASAFTSYCKPVTEKWGGEPYEYAIANDIISKEGTLTMYNMDIDMSAFDPYLTSAVTVNKVYGYYVKNNEYYFLVNYTAYNDTKDRYIKASDTKDLVNFTSAAISPSAGYLKQTAPDEITSGDSNPGGKPGSNMTTKSPTNNLERYILIAVIAVLCVVIIILIFAPNRSRRNPNNG